MKKILLASLLLPQLAIADPVLVKANGKWIRTISDENGIAVIEAKLTGNQTSKLMLSVTGAAIKKVVAFGTRVPKLNQREPRPWKLDVESEESILDSLDSSSCLQYAKETVEPEVLEFPAWDSLGLSPELYLQFRALFTIIFNELGGLAAPGRCGRVSASSQAALTQLFTTTFNGTWSPALTCQFMDSPFLDASFVFFGVVPSTANSKIANQRMGSGLGRFRTTYYKDACTPIERKRPYLVRFGIKLKKGASAPIAINLAEETYSGNQGASIKPESEGRFAPNPLLLMEMIRACGQKVHEATWRRERPLVSELKAEDLITFHNRSFVRVDMGGRMSGGEASYVLSTPDTAYGVCFQRNAVRQYASDYPRVQ
jgi:hypothetical protein